MAHPTTNIRRHTVVLSDEKLSRQIELYRERLKDETGMEVSMSRVLQALIRKGLAATSDKKRSVG